jgi:hypothetical protein
VKWTGKVACVRRREIYNRLVEENEGKRLIGTRWEDNIKIDVK